MRVASPQVRDTPAQDRPTDRLATGLLPTPEARFTGREAERVQAAWNGSWNEGPRNSSGISACSAIRRDVCAGSGWAAYSRASRIARNGLCAPGNRAGYHPGSMTSCIGRENSSWAGISCPICLVDGTAGSSGGGQQDPPRCQEDRRRARTAPLAEHAQAAQLAAWMRGPPLSLLRA